MRTRQQIINGEGKRPPAQVDLAELAHNPFNPRDELTDIEETAGSLRDRGQLQPIAVVRKAAFLQVHPDQKAVIGDAEYVVIDGNRRLAAAHEAGLATLRIDVNDDLAASAESILEVALIANIHRVDVPPMDQAKAIQELVAAHGKQGIVAKLLGKSDGWISQRLALLRLPDDLQEKVETGDLKVRDARRIARLPADEMRAEASQAMEPGAPKPRRVAQPKPAAPESEGSVTDIPAQGTGRDGVVDSAAEPVAAPRPEAAEETSEDAGSEQGEPYLVDIRNLPRVPWHDGAEVAVLITHKVSPGQQEVLLERLFATMDEQRRDAVLERLIGLAAR
ncbi:ParB/RepB/Spo0J family partition protein [Streptomyces sp. NPDC097619]|uniref:ParB/RepB/Spo0J family partition protein n=1 Tax=Streptomyces sp. NPDC097619 TaxID=3157228 RepID=UPI003327C447